MSFEAFARAIVAPGLKQVARHWNAARGTHAMPRWCGLRPSAMAAQLSIIWSYRYDRQSDRFIGRVAGDAIEVVFGKRFRDTPMEALFPVDVLPYYFARHRRVVTEPCFFSGWDGVFDHLSRVGTGERIIMPLSDCGHEGDGILGATVYGTSEPRTHKVSTRPESEEWFAFD